MLPSIYFEPKGSSSEDSCMHMYGMICLHAEITINGFYIVYKYKILEFFKYIDVNIKFSRRKNLSILI